MLSLSDVRKVYDSAGESVEALKGLSVHFRPHEFVSILGPSGCGKTTLLNIIGGLDRYTSGDLVIEGTSTKLYGDREWDSYRNHRVGFVFQNYQLIPHQSVLANVELALTLSGVPKAERRRRATEALERVGLGDQLKKRPSQMSGGQMQRVAIARALVNNPEILLADEPTGALDTQTSEQIMDLLAEVAKDRLVIMVTHNPDLAERYSSRIVRMLDGNLLSDTNPYDGISEEIVKEVAIEETAEPEKKKSKKKTGKEKKTSMSFFTALALSCNNLLTKKTRTALVSFAGSIGIVGIALILALSNGIQAYINRVEADALSSTPIAIEAATMDMNQLINLMTGAAKGDDNLPEEGYVGSTSAFVDIFQAVSGSIKTNDLKSFKEYIESDATKIADKNVSTIEYSYGVTPQIWSSYKNAQGKDTWLKVNDSEVFDGLFGNMTMGNFSFTLFDQLLDNQNLLENQYDLLAGDWPTAKDQVVLVVDKNHKLSDIYLYALGLKDPDELKDIMATIIANHGKPESEQQKITIESASYTYEELMENLKFRVAIAGDLYTEENGKYIYRGEDQAHLTKLFGGNAEDASVRTMELSISGIICPSNDSAATSIVGTIGYTSALNDYILEMATETAVYKAQAATPETDVTTGLPFSKSNSEKIEQMKAVYAFEGKTAEEIKSLYTALLPTVTLGTQMAKAKAFLQQSNDVNYYAAIAAMLLKANADNLGGLTAGMGSMGGMGGISGNFDLSMISEEQLKAMLPNLMGEAELLDLTAMLIAYFGLSDNGEILPGYEPIETLVAQAMMQSAQMSDAQIAAAYGAIYTNLPDSTWLSLWQGQFGDTVSSSTYNQNMTLFGMADRSVPKTINIYPLDFAQKDYIISEIDKYNEGKDANEMITYTDLVGALFSSISMILDVIKYVLVAFVSISLVVSSIMIGIITYISVLERTKEIGILRSVGASKGDVGRVFNAETLIIGFCAGMIGILSTLILMIPINIIIRALTGFSSIGAVLKFSDAATLVIISMVLTLISGLIPSFKAAKKDPVEALRSE